MPLPLKPEFIDNTPYDPIGGNAPCLPDAKILDEEKPIAIELTALEIGTLFGSGGTRNDFRDLIMRKFREAGVPMNDSFLNPGPAHGAIYRTKENDTERRVFRYVWMPQAYVLAMQLATARA